MYIFCLIKVLLHDITAETTVGREYSGPRMLLFVYTYLPVKDEPTTTAKSHKWSKVVDID